MRELAAFLMAVGIHEGGHLLAAWLAGVPLRYCMGRKNGLQLRFATEGLSYGRELWVLLGGSVWGLLSLLLIQDRCYVRYALVLNLVNLLPLQTLDGGGILTCLLHLALSGDVADRIACGVSKGTAVVFWLCGTWIALRTGGNVGWMLVGLGMILGESR